jgi:ABC-2 type transport system permease protein
VVWLGNRFKYSNAVTMVIYILLMIVAIVGSIALPAAMDNPEKLSAGALSLSTAFDMYPPVAWFAKTLTGGGIIWGITIAVVSCAVFGLVSVLLARVYIKINAASRERHTRSTFKLGAVTVTGALPALVIKEIKGFFSAYIYVMNSGIGMILFTIYNVAVCAVGFDTVAGILELPGGDELYAVVSAAIGAFCITMSCITAPSISVEGRTLWILKTLPIRFSDIAKGKILMALLMTVPLTVINSALILITSGMSLMTYLAMTLSLCVLCVFVAVFGFTMNLLFPKLEWNSIIQAVKQSASVGFTMVGGMLVSVLCGLFIGFSGLGIEAGMFISAGFLLILSGLLVIFLLRKGRRVFDAL